MNRREGIALCNTAASSSSPAQRNLADFALALLDEIKAQEKHIMLLETQLAVKARRDKHQKQDYNNYMRVYMQEYRKRKREEA